jgi:hypothetical protein
MKSLLLSFSLLLCFFSAFGADTPVDLSLTDGSRIRGKVMSSNGSEVTVMSDIGVLRIALEKLTPESRQSIEQTTKPDTASLLKRIAELEGKVAQLQQENEALRRQSVASPSPTYRPSALQSLTPSGSTSKPTAEASHTISSTGKRHNSGCRFFGSGRSCGPTDGIACKICGG